MEVDDCYTICPAPGCPGTNPDTRKRLSQGTAAEVALFKLRSGQPVEWYCHVLLNKWEKKLIAGEVEADLDPFAIHAKPHQKQY